MPTADVPPEPRLPPRPAPRARRRLRTRIILSFALLGLGLTRVMMHAHATSPHARQTPPAGDRMAVALRRPDVLVLLATFVALGAALQAAVSALPLLVTGELGLDLEWSGVALGTCAALEIPILVVLGRVTTRFGPRRVVAVGCLDELPAPVVGEGTGQVGVVGEHDGSSG